MRYLASLVMVLMLARMAIVAVVMFMFVRVAIVPVMMLMLIGVTIFAVMMIVLVGMAVVSMVMLMIRDMTVRHRRRGGASADKQKEGTADRGQMCFADHGVSLDLVDGRMNIIGQRDVDVNRSPCRRVLVGFARRIRVNCHEGAFS
ncbi:MAG: hypothetical protein AB8G17_13630 [Gammaproteobacteria bacterium]